MAILNKYTQEQWQNMLDLKSGLTEMRTTNENGRFDAAIDHYKKAFKTFLTHKDFRKELPEEEDHAAAAA